MVGNGIEDREIGLRLEHHLDVGEVERAVLEGREHGDAHVRRAEPAVGDPAPQDRVHLRHVRAPQHEGVGGLEIVVAAHRLVHAEAAHEAHDADAMQWRALGSRLLERNPALNSLLAA